MRYNKLRVLGKGTYGIVYLITDNTNKKYSLKKMLYNKDMIKSCKNELKILKLVKSDNIIKIKSYFIRNGYFNIIMEYAPNGDLNNYIKQHKNKFAIIKSYNIKKIILSITEGLKALHKLEIIHRDIKPSNILICENFNIKITDFGISKIVDNKYAVFTKIGTPYYMSPEMLNGKKYSFEIDYWSLGCILYELLTFKRPFESNSLHGLYQKITKGNYNTYNLNNKYKNLVKGLLQKNPNNRIGPNEIINHFNQLYKDNIITEKKDNIITEKKDNIIIKNKRIYYNNLYDKYKHNDKYKKYYEKLKPIIPTPLKLKKDPKNPKKYKIPKILPKKYKNKINHNYMFYKKRAIY